MTKALLVYTGADRRQHEMFKDIYGKDGERPYYHSSQHLWFQSLIAKRRAQNQTTTIPILGKRGKGKTMTCFRLIELLDSNCGLNFNVNTHIVFTPSQFIQQSDKLDEGCVMGFDETSAGWGHRDWQSAVNRALAKYSQTYRQRRGTRLSPDLIMTMPHLGLLDKVGRSLCEYGIRMERQGFAKIYSIETNDFEGSYWPVLRAQLRNVRMPFRTRPEALQTYDEMKAQVEKERMVEYLAQAKAAESKSTHWQRSKDPAVIVERIINEGIPASYFKQGMESLDPRKISYYEKIPLATAYTLKTILEEKLPSITIRNEKSEEIIDEEDSGK